MRKVAASFALVCFLFACSSSTESTADATASSLAVSTSLTTPTTEPTTTTFPDTTSTVPTVDVTSENVINGLFAHGAPIDEYFIYNASSDPNELLGRPGGYVGKATFRDARLETQFDDYQVEDGGSIEVFVNSGQAASRSSYIQTLIQDSPLFDAEYHFLEGTVLLRVSGRLTPEDTEIYESALASTISDLNSGITPPSIGTTASTTTTPAAPTNPLPAIDGVLIVGNRQPDFGDGEHGTVTVVTSYAAPTSSGDTLVYVVVRNNTPDPVAQLEASGIFRDGQGLLAGSGSSNDFAVDLVVPGGVSWTTLFLSDVQLPLGEVNGDFTLTWESESDSRQLNLEVQEWNETASAVVAIAKNESAETHRFVEGYLLCLDASSTPIGAREQFADPIEVEPDGETAVTVSFPSGCNSSNIWLLAIRG